MRAPLRRALKRPESVLVVVHTAAGSVLMLRRLRPPDFWQSVTGSLAWDERSPSEAARRELWEETGLGEALEIVDCGASNRFPILPEWRHRYGSACENLEHVFRIEVPEGIEVTLNPYEHSEYLWLPREAAAAKASSYTNRDAILRFVSGASGTDG